MTFIQKSSTWFFSYPFEFCVCCCKLFLCFVFSFYSVIFNDTFYVVLHYTNKKEVSNMSKMELFWYCYPATNLSNKKRHKCLWLCLSKTVRLTIMLLLVQKSGKWYRVCCLKRICKPFGLTALHITLMSPKRPSQEWIIDSHHMDRMLWLHMPIRGFCSFIYASLDCCLEQRITLLFLLLSISC